MDHLIFIAFALILITLASMQFILMSVPFFQRITFDALCHQALMQMDQAGGMTAAIASRLETDLIARGFRNPVIHGDPPVSYGQEMGLVVQAELGIDLLTPAWSHQKSVKTFVYENSLLSRHLLTSAGTP